MQMDIVGKCTKCRQGHHLGELRQFGDGPLQEKRSGQHFVCKHTIKRATPPCEMTGVMLQTEGQTPRELD